MISLNFFSRDKNSYKFKTYSRLIGRKHDHDIYAWCVFLSAGSDSLKDVEYVEYTLHPSFPEPVRVIKDSDHCFVIQSQGWGNFLLRIRVQLKSGEAVRQTYEVDVFNNSWPIGPIAKGILSGRAEKIYQSLMEEEWEWRKLTTLARRADASEEDTTKLLKEMEQQKLVRQAYYLSLDNVEMWGATARVGLMPSPEAISKE